MSKGNLDEALNNANVTYKQLVEIANEIVSKCTDSVDNIIKPAQESIERLNNDDIRTLMLKIAMASYAFSEIKEKSAFKAQCAEALRKESYANEFNSAVGSVAAKENTATVNISLVNPDVYDPQPEGITRYDIRLFDVFPSEVSMPEISASESADVEIKVTFNFNYFLLGDEIEGQ